MSAFDELVSAMDGAMVVVTAAADDQRGGCLVGFHNQCSIDPERYAVWLSKANYTYRVALFAGHLAVHRLAAGDHDVAARWGGTSGDEVDQFATADWTAGPAGVPLLDDLPSRLVGRIDTVVDPGGDHVCFVVEPIEVHGEPAGAPLRLSQLDDVEPGHGQDDRTVPDLHDRRR